MYECLRKIQFYIRNERLKIQNLDKKNIESLYFLHFSLHFFSPCTARTHLPLVYGICKTVQIKKSRFSAYNTKLSFATNTKSKTFILKWDYNRIISEMVEKKKRNERIGWLIFDDISRNIINYSAHYYRAIWPHTHNYITIAIYNNYNIDCTFIHQKNLR